jgi:hypothetical protein
MLGSQYGDGTAHFLERLGRWSPRFGTSGAVVMTELFFADGEWRRAAACARQDGQRMAALPCALVVRDLAAGVSRQAGAMTAYEFLGAVPLLEQLGAAGFEVKVVSD